ncbi:hypothetical protein [Rhodococcus sp. 27YEA15]|uniref:hypothetical protein n=1 Tax=Rhodococcus sp. 27YEA15 TaxID=3156259 RepID=UPI003C798FC1
MVGPGSVSPHIVVGLRLLGGALSRDPLYRSVFCHRDAAFTILVVGALDPAFAEATVAHTQQVMQAVSPWSAGYSLLNFTATADPERIARTYDDDTTQAASCTSDRFRVGYDAARRRSCRGDRTRGGPMPGTHSAPCAGSRHAVSGIGSAPVFCPVDVIDRAK